MKIRLSASGLDLTAELEKYAHAKIAQLAKKVPRDLRAPSLCDVHFMQSRKKDAKLNTCVVAFTLDSTKLKAEETTLHMYAALDIAIVHLEHQLADFVASRKSPLKARIKKRLRGA
jgi:ribosomal subunit interface protein